MMPPPSPRIAPAIPAAADTRKMTKNTLDLALGHRPPVLREPILCGEGSSFAPAMRWERRDVLAHAPGQGLRGAVTDSATSGPMEQPADRHAEHRERKRRPRMPMHGAALRKPEMSGGRPTKKKPRRRRKK